MKGYNIMDFKKIKSHLLFKKLANRYVIIFIIYAIWMLFFDENSYLTHREFNNEIDDLKTWIDYHKQKIIEDKATIKKLEDSLELERYAREKYLMKKENEEIYIIDFE